MLTNHHKLKDYDLPEEIYDIRNIEIEKQLIDLYKTEDFNYTVWYKNNLNKVYTYVNGISHEYDYYIENGKIKLKEINKGINMEIKKFNIKEDLKKLENYLREQYINNKNMTSWLPERLHDLIYRMDTQYEYAGKEKSSDYIYLWLDNNEIVSCILPDGDAIYVSIKKGYEYLYESIVEYAEENCTPLFKKDENGFIEFLVIANDSLKYREEVLKSNGYIKQKESDYDNYVYPQEFNTNIDLPDGYKLVYGNEYTNEVNKWSACNLGFHPDLEEPNYKNNMSAYNSRKESSMYKDSFECLIIDENEKENNDICSYCFVYVDKESKTAFIEPVSTREKYRHMGIGTAMMHGVILKCKELGIEKCYVNSYDWRKKFYNAAGFKTEDSVGFWTKRIK